MLETVTAPADPAVSTADAKAHLRVTFDDDDALIGSYISAAERMIEETAHVQLMQATYRYHLPEWPGECVELPRPPLQQVTSITYYDSDGNSQTLAASVYDVEAFRFVGRVRLKPGQSWPTLDSTKRHPIQINYIAGAATAGAIEKLRRQALLLLVTHLYEMRQPYVPGVSISEVPKTVDSLVALFRVPHPPPTEF